MSETKTKKEKKRRRRKRTEPLIRKEDLALFMYFILYI